MSRLHMSSQEPCNKEKGIESSSPLLSSVIVTNKLFSLPHIKNKNQNRKTEKEILSHV